MRVHYYCIFLASIFLFITIHYVKMRKLDFRYCLLWIGISLVLVILAANKNILEAISRYVGIYYSPAFLFVTGIIFSLILIFYLTLVISAMQKKIVKLTQEVGILKSELERHGAK